eukprot:gnl/MRDRNA2_/MRDRNA2_147458_c0_seq1.p1 gnl/MRDRNA2_/MRDRNA2_147458_c0~~gnl/MRDRNA2_/MRDRNA2_147458_c0_seq1.p1  ORF type:complete len:226 (-),score=38.80 gnl/MRDRNA2_/MRDRNA2_147458_c0_seq1:70-657(-)
MALFIVMVVGAAAQHVEQEQAHKSTIKDKSVDNVADNLIDRLYNQVAPALLARDKELLNHLDSTILAKMPETSAGRRLSMRATPRMQSQVNNPLRTGLRAASMQPAQPRFLPVANLFGGGDDDQPTPPPVKLPEGVSEPKIFPNREKPKYGFVRNAEIQNSRAAMIGFMLILLIEGTTGQPILDLLGYGTNQFQR